MREGAILAAIVLVAPAFAGCLGTASAATAEDNRDSADERAQQWDSQAQLAEVVGLEGHAAQWMGSWGFDHDYSYDYDGEYGGQDWGQDSHDGPRTASSHGSSSGNSPWDRAAEDENMADGRCKVWAYTYVSANKPGETLVVFLDEDGEVVDAQTEDRGGEEALSDWEIDSDEAADIAEDANDGIEEGRNSEYKGFVFVLEEDDDHENPTWTVAGGGGDESGGGGGVVVIDAVTGDVLESQGGSSR